MGGGGGKAGFSLLRGRAALVLRKENKSCCIYLHICLKPEKLHTLDIIVREL